MTDRAALAQRIAGRLRDVPDFPKPGIVFKDIAGLLADGAAFAAVIEGLAATVDGTVDGPAGGAAIGPVDLVAGVEARGFLVAGALATELGCGVVPVRKAGKLPPPTVRKVYDLEYGTAEIEVPLNVLDGKRVLLVDDILATGGTLRAAAELLQQAGAEVAAMAVIVELTALGGRAALAGLPPLDVLLSV